MNFRRFRLLSTAILACLAASAAHSQPASRDTAYRIGPKDVVQLEVLEDASLNLDSARVNDEGMIELLHVGEIRIGGLTAAQARVTLEEELERYLQRATVSIRVIEFRSRPITILGAVHSPGPLEFSGRWTLLEAIMEAGGPTENAGKLVHVTRRATNGLSDRLAIPLRDLVERANPLVNIPLAGDDLVNVQTATPVTIFCIGELNGAGAITFQGSERVTLLAAIARAGGLSDRASNQILVRRGETGEEISVSWKKLLSGKTPDVPLFAGDFVIVKESFF